MGYNTDKIIRRLGRQQGAVDLLLERQSTITNQLERLMALADDLKAQVGQLNDATNETAQALADNAAALQAVRDNIAQLAARISNSMSDQEVADIKAALSAAGQTVGTVHAGITGEHGVLVDLAKDPTNPVPPTPPAVAAARQASAEAAGKP